VTTGSLEKLSPGKMENIKHIQPSGDLAKKISKQNIDSANRFF
jgi:hypothetical protein